MPGISDEEVDAAFVRIDAAYEALMALDPATGEDALLQTYASFHHTHGGLSNRQVTEVDYPPVDDAGWTDKLLRPLFEKSRKVAAARLNFPLTA
ncbi:hypothetical protein [Azospirillum sp. SYSU D00513]|uniref:hypothetical protein n=1 Tax=Azospirillum sp. SYSU D00513 TaxID=2812561 RepID=UPI001A97616D|nr:hypothetical protein [Azospirillum sp. SYSU D00513]